MTTEQEALEVLESGKPIRVEPGTYPGAVNAIADTVGKYGTQWRYEFRLDGFPEELPWAWAAKSLGTRTKNYEWVTTLLGRPLALNEKVTKAQLIGLRCNVVITDKADIERASGFKRIVSGILPATKATAVQSVRVEGTVIDPPKAAAAPLPDKCYCGKPVSSYTANGTPLCEKHTAEAMQE